MGSVAAADPKTEPAPARGEGPPAGSADGGVIGSLGSWMAVLGAIRLVCAIAEYASAWRASMAAGSPAGESLWTYVAEHPPIYLLVAAWPMVLGLILVRSGWPELVKAGALTFLVLSVAGLLLATVEWADPHRRFVEVGSFRVSRVSVLRLGESGLAKGLAGVVQLVLELVTGVRAAVWAIRGFGRAAADDDRRVAARRTRLDRLTLLMSLGFLALTIRLPGWSTSLELLTRSQFVRDLLVGEERTKGADVRMRQPAPARWLRDGSLLHDEAYQAWGEGRYVKARDTYLRLVAILDPMSPTPLNSVERAFVSRTYNDLAWLLATCPDAELRDGERAVRFARRSLEFEPSSGNTWNTLGVAYFRLGDMERSRSALYRSMELQNEGSSIDWFFLAMIHQREGRKERAREWYDKAAQAVKQMPREAEELYRFQSEAADALGLPRPKPPVNPAQRSFTPSKARTSRPKSRLRVN